MLKEVKGVMNRSGKFLSLMAPALLLGATAILGAQPQSLAASGPASQRPLVVVPGLQTAFLDNFNPLSPSAMTGTFGLIYQPLFYFNTVGPQVYPLLGRSYQWSDNNLVLTVKLRTGAKWSNGTPVTASDVVFSYTILRKYPSLDVNGVWATISSVSAVNSSTVKFVFKTPDVPFASTL
jgi:peptide/nickel transport system substrate-binding protein